MSRILLQWYAVSCIFPCFCIAAIDSKFDLGLENSNASFSGTLHQFDKAVRPFCLKLTESTRNGKIMENNKIKQCFLFSLSKGLTPASVINYLTLSLALYREPLHPREFTPTMNRK